MSTEERIDLSIVIPAYGAEDLVVRCVESVRRALAESPLATEVIVADDASPGDFAENIRERCPEARLEVGERNLGFAGNANRGVAVARGRILCLLNSDMRVKPGFFDECLEPFDDPALFGVAPRILEPSGRDDGYKRLRFDGARAIVEHFRVEDPECLRPAWIPYTGSGFFHRDKFRELGGFSEAYAPYYWEDTDLGYRAWKRGYRIAFEPSKVIEHEHQGTISSQNDKRVSRIFKRHGRIFVWRNLTSRSLTSLVVATSVLPALAALLKLRFARCGWLLGDLRHFGSAHRARTAARATDVHSDEEVLRLVSEPRVD